MYHSTPKSLRYNWGGGYIVGALSIPIHITSIAISLFYEKGTYFTQHVLELLMQVISRDTSMPHMLPKIVTIG